MLVKDKQTKQMKTTVNIPSLRPSCVSNEIGKTNENVISRVSKEKCVMGKRKHYLPALCVLIVTTLSIKRGTNRLVKEKRLFCSKGL